jgi:hypothetical protein
LGKQKVLNLVAIDEIGLCECSLDNPLKILHSLLEPPKVVFFGISNWKLDASKMNRGISLCRPPNSTEDLIETAMSISEQVIDSAVNKELKEYYQKLVEVYENYIKQL